MSNTPITSNETPEQAAMRFAASFTAKGYQLDGLHIYQGSDGSPVYWRIRLKHPDTGDKIIWPMHRDSKGEFILKEPQFAGQKPLYNLPGILKAADSPVYVLEGEKCADALVKLGLISTTSGGNTSAASADWSALRGRDVFIWPDNDEEGLRYAEAVAQCLIALGCHVSQVDIKKLNLPDKGDIVDWLNANPDAKGEDVQKLPLIELESVKSATDEEVINVLAQLSEIVYQRQRKATAKSLGLTLAALDKAVKQARSELGDKTEDIFPLIEPWEESVILSDLLNDLEATLNRFLVLSSPHEAKAIALWIVHTHCIDAAKVSPLLNISSPEKRCGKSTLLALLLRLVKQPLLASNITASALFRSIEKWSPTLLIDEADSFMKENEELRGIINSGHTRDLAYTLRCVGDKHEPTRFCTWGAKAIAGIGHQADTIQDRSVCIQLRRKLPHESRDQLRDVLPSLFNDLLRKCVRFALDSIKQLAEIKPSIPRELNDRAADNWQPLLAIADLAGGDWPKAAREAGLALSGVESSPSVSIELLQDIKRIFNAKKIERIWTFELLQSLYANTEAPWLTYNRGKPLSDRQLASKLGEFNIASKDIRAEGKIKKGYELKDFEDTFERYLSQNAATAPSTATALHASNYAASSNIGERNTGELLLLEKPSEALPDAGCSVVAANSPDLVSETREDEIRRVIL